MKRVLDDVLSNENLAVERVSTVDYVAGRLRAMIAEGRLPQGEHLREVPLAEAFSVSRTTIRDAIRVLAGDGLVTVEFHKGAMVTLLSRDDIIEVYRIRRLLELPALLGVADGHPDATELTRQALRRCAEAAKRGIYSEFVEAELEYHASIVAHLRSPRTDHFFGSVLSTLRLALSLLGEDRDPPTIRALVQRYTDIFEDAREGRIESAQAELLGHLEAYEERLLDSAPIDPGGSAS